MGKLNGTALLLYVDGVLIAAQKGFTFGVSQDLFDTSNKESAGWEEHENGMAKADVSFEGLMSTTGLSADGLINYIITRKSFVLVLAGLTYPWVMTGDITTTTLSANKEDAATISGSVKVQGKPYYLSGTNANLMTDPDGGGTDYDTCTVSGIKITHASSIGGDKHIYSNSFAVFITDTIKFITFITLNTASLPKVCLVNSTSDAVDSNIVQLVAGLNVITLTPTDSTTMKLKIGETTSAGDWSTTDIYLFKAT